MTASPSFEPHAIVRPALSPAAAQALVAEHYGFTPAGLKPLDSFQDQNFRVTDAAGRRFVLKIANSHETFETLDLQNQVMLHLAATQADFPSPRVVVNKAGAGLTPIEQAGARHWIRLLTYLEGQTLVATPVLTPGLLDDIGVTVGRMTAHLADFAHPAQDRVIQWDLRQAPAVTAAFIKYVDDPRRRATVEHLLADFERETAPQLAGLRTSVIHGDIVDYNLLVGKGAAGQYAVSGIIDFGDAVRSYTIGELAVLLATVMTHCPDDPLAAAARVVAQYHAAYPLTEAELAGLFPLVCLRVCATTTSAAQQAALEPDNRYVQEFAAAEWPALERLAALSPALAQAFFRGACGLEPHPGAAAVRGWLRAHTAALGPVFEGDLARGAVTALDLSISADDLTAGMWERPAAVHAYIMRRMAEHEGAVLAGRYAEARLTETRYASDTEPAAIHLGVDVFRPAETVVLAPLAGVVARRAHQHVTLKHVPEPGVEFYTHYAGLLPDEMMSEGAPVHQGQMLGRVAPAKPEAALPAHVHVQLAGDRPEPLPHAAVGSEREVWLSVCPDPNLLLNLPGLTPPQELPERAELVERRRRALAQSQETYYRRPMQMVRGWRQYLIDDTGRAYLDAINNVAQVGHSHPRVAEAAARQMARLNTNNRFVYAGLVEYAERLKEWLPAELNTIFLVCSGSEANDLALRLARAYTGAEHVLTIDGAYHGNTTAVYEVSTSILDNPTAAKDVKPYIHPLVQPNTYRGRYGADDPDAGVKYAAEAEIVLDALRDWDQRPAAFIGECLLGAPGGMVPPAGYFPRVYAAVQAAGGVCIADEVQVGLGRMGTHRWAFEMQGVQPDIVTMGKPLGNGFPLSAVATRPEIAEAFRRRFTYFNTFGGNPVSCAAGLAVLDVMRDEGLQDNAREAGAYFKAQLETLIPKHALVGAVYGHGLYLGVDLVRDREAKTPATPETMALCERMRDYGVIVYPTGDYYNILKIKPPLVFSKADADFFVGTLDRVLTEGW